MGSKIYAGKGFPTPDTLGSGDFACRTFRIPSDKVFLGNVTGALLALTDADNWQDYGVVSRDDAAAAAAVMLDSGWGADICLLGESPPYWDGANGENAEDKNPVDTGYPWYEDLSWTFIEAFLSTLVTPSAAFAYITVVKKFRLAYLKRDFGAIFDVQIDGNTVATIDTYSPVEEVGFVDVVIP
jgi:hypothetical protein